MKSVLKDLTGEKFGKLTVQGRAEQDRMIGKKKPKKRVTWECKCDCGNPDVILKTGNELQNGHAISCGCVKQSIIASQHHSLPFDLLWEHHGANHPSPRGMGICKR